MCVNGNTINNSIKYTLYIVYILYAYMQYQLKFSNQLI